MFALWKVEELLLDYNGFIDLVWLTGLSALKKDSTPDSTFLGSKEGMKTPPGKEGMCSLDIFGFCTWHDLREIP